MSTLILRIIYAAFVGFIVPMSLVAIGELLRFFGRAIERRHNKKRK